MADFPQSNQTLLLQILLEIQETNERIFSQNLQPVLWPELVLVTVCLLESHGKRHLLQWISHSLKSLE